MALLRDASGRVGDQREVARALAVDGRELVDEGALPDRLEVGGELELVTSPWWKVRTLPETTVFILSLIAERGCLGL